MRTKIVYYSMFLWALITYFAEPTFLSFLLSFAWATGATIYVFEDYSVVRVLDFVRYRYR